MERDCLSGADFAASRFSRMSWHSLRKAGTRQAEVVARLPHNKLLPPTTVSTYLFATGEGSLCALPASNISRSGSD
jgi:hypothetical protein